ncbi:ABC transporter ATP-binding protein [Limnohabitans sp. MMS-10A-178]|uniref:ABC transporter ATP-binding protein n=1 Tax=Limnohabitans sp. MMS-10A-178 TaxID=1835767 RepID=UPI000D3B4A37|nr:ABC transporter ATP-binding protein [Limnohabitans sp. MMS-10A-178]PUE16859.1 ABC transporter ATP-binding protein [Limnohabitans sp. MMS-10A-178]
MLEIEEIACGYGKIEALRKVSLKANQNAVTCLLGPNGAGKTTLMMSLAGILKPTHGSIKFEGQNLIGLTPSQIVQRGLALVPENRLVFPALTVRENLMAGAYLRKDKPGIANDIEQQLHRFPRLHERIGQLAGTLSGGEQQMLAVGRALMSRPRLLMMDEPSVGLAPKVVAEIFGIIQKLHHEGTTIFLVEQNVHMAMKVAQHFYLLQQGRVTFSGTPDQLAGDDLVKRAYLAGHSAAA